MKIHLQSDMHIEMGQWLGPAVSSDVVVCAGDIGNLDDLNRLEKYFNDIRTTTDNIIWVLGNHEFYHSDYQECLKIAEQFAKEEGILLLDEALGTENLVLDGVTFWGSTLWTDFKSDDWFVKQKVGNGLNDFRVVTNGESERDIGLMKNFTAEDSRIINERTRAKINWDADVVITHHVPVVIEHTRFPISNITYGFCNDGMEQQIMDSKIKYWMYGHTHDSRHTTLNGTQIISNQQGYPTMAYHTGETTYEPTNFDPSLIIEV